MIITYIEYLISNNPQSHQWLYKHIFSHDVSPIIYIYIDLYTIPLILKLLLF